MSEKLVSITTEDFRRLVKGEKLIRHGVTIYFTDIGFNIMRAIITDIEIKDKIKKYFSTSALQFNSGQAGSAQGKNHEIILVFDSSDPMGDKYRQENITVVYTPKDNYYKNADDKIIEVTRQKFNTENYKEKINIITNDLDLTRKIEKLARAQL